MSLSRLAVVSVTCMLAMEMGWPPSLVTTKKTGSNPCSRKFTEKILRPCPGSVVRVGGDRHHLRWDVRRVPDKFSRAGPAGFDEVLGRPAHGRSAQRECYDAQ